MLAVLCGGLLLLIDYIYRKVVFLQDESFGFGSHDSFDEHLSQIPIEEERQDMTDASMSPVLKKRRTSIHSHKTKMKPSGRYC